MATETPTKTPELTTFPLLPLRDVVVFPHMVIPLFVGRPKSIKALDVAMEAGKHILLVAQKSAAKDDPAAEDLYDIGSVATVLQMLKLPDGTVKVLVEGTQRALIQHVDESGDYLSAEATLLVGAEGATHEVEAMRRALLTQFDQYVKLNKKIPPEILTSMSGIDDGGRLADAIAAHLPLKLEQKQEILEMQEVGKRLEHLLGLLEGEVDILQVEKRIRGRVKRQMEKSQREYYLNEQVKAIQKELGEGDDNADLDETEKKIKAAKMSKEAECKAMAELKKLRMMSPMSAEATVVRNYIDTLLGLPWRKKSKINKDLANAVKVLDADHYGLEKVKERIVEYLAVQQRVDRLKAPILCLVGAPGRGQDLARPVDRARDQPQVRAHVAGRRARRGGDPRPPSHLHRLDAGQDPAEHDQGRRAQSAVPARRSRQDGHGLPRRSVLGAAGSARPRAEQHLHRSLRRGRVRPVRRDVRRHREHAQHSAARCSTAWRSSGCPATPRLEKIAIAKQYLVPKQMKNNGIKENELHLAESALRDITRYYTREAGVRALERDISKICRKVVKGLLLRESEGKPRAAKSPVEVNAKNLDKYLGVRKFTYGIAEKKNQVGQVTGLAWTEVGGDLLTIEAVALPGKGKTTTTGKLGDVMNESIAGRAVGRAPPLEAARHRARLLSEDRSAHPPARRRHAEGRAERRHRDRHRDGVDSHRHSGARRRGDDRRDHAARRSAADRRAEGEAARGRARRDQAGADPGRERQGPDRDLRRDQEPARHSSGALDRAGARDGARAPAGPSRRSGGGQAGGARRRPAPMEESAASSKR